MHSTGDESVVLFLLLHRLTSDRVTNKYPGGKPSDRVCRLKKLHYDEHKHKFTDMFYFCSNVLATERSAFNLSSSVNYLVLRVV